MGIQPAVIRLVASVILAISAGLAAHSTTNRPTAASASCCDQAHQPARKRSWLYWLTVQGPIAVLDVWDELVTWVVAGIVLTTICLRYVQPLAADAHAQFLLSLQTLPGFEYMESGIARLTSCCSCSCACCCSIVVAIVLSVSARATWCSCSLSPNCRSHTVVVVVDGSGECLCHLVYLFSFPKLLLSASWSASSLLAFVLISDLLEFDGYYVFASQYHARMLE